MVPVPFIWRNRIMKKLKDCGAVSAPTAKTLMAAGVPYHDNIYLQGVIKMMLREKNIAKTSDDRYYLLQQR